MITRIFENQVVVKWRRDGGGYDSRSYKWTVALTKLKWYVLLGRAERKLARVLLGE